MKARAPAFVCAAVLGQVVALSQSPLAQTKSRPSARPATPASVSDWEHRLLGGDQKVRAMAEAALVRDGSRSLPLLKRFLSPQHEALHVVTFEIIRRIGPPAIPLLVELLR